MSKVFPIGFNPIRKALANQIQLSTGLTSMLEEPEKPNQPRPDLPYISFKLTSPAIKSGDDSKQNVLDNLGQPTTVWNSGGVRKMMVSFQCYGNNHEEAYDYLSLLQASLDLEDVQENLRRSGVAVWTIGNVADLTKLLNTGYEGRAHMDCSFGIASNIQSDLGAMEEVTVEGTITSENKEIDTTETIS